MEVLCFDFLNSDWRDWRGSGRREDRLLNEEWLKSFLEKWDLAADPVLEEDTYQVLVRLRTRLQKMVEALVNHQSLSPTDITFLNEWLQQTSYHLQLVGHLGELKQVPSTTEIYLRSGGFGNEKKEVRRRPLIIDAKQNRTVCGLNADGLSIAF